MISEEIREHEKKAKSLNIKQLLYVMNKIPLYAEIKNIYFCELQRRLDVNEWEKIFTE